MNRLFKNWRTFVIKESNSYPGTEIGKKSQTMETLMIKLQDLLKSWPACKSAPDSMACKYHKDLEKVVEEYGVSYDASISDSINHGNNIILDET